MKQPTLENLRLLYRAGLENGITLKQVTAWIRFNLANNGNPAPSCTIKKVAGKWCVRLWVGGKHNPKTDYYTDCPNDAKLTADYACRSFVRSCAKYSYEHIMELWGMK